MLSLITVWTPEALRARTFAVAQIVENLGRMCADPLLLRAFGASIHLDGIWPGMPFFVATVRCHGDPHFLLQLTSDQVGFSTGAVAWRFVRLEGHSR